MIKRILVIDDDIDVGEIVCTVAQALSWHCTLTSDATAFLEHLTPEIQLIFLDLMIPEVDGIELLRLLGQQHCVAGIVLMSGVGKRVLETAKQLAQALGLHVVGELQKPFQLAELEEMMSRPYARPVQVRNSGIQSAAPIPNVELRNAVKRNEFVVHYQPQIEIGTGKVMGLEALVRWQRPGGDLVFPDAFIARIEALGWISDLGWLVTKRALAEIEQFADEQGDIPGISINASVHSLMDLSFPDRLTTLARKFDVPPEKVTIEITESGLIKELSKALDVLTRLRMKSVQISIDDFGTGYSMMQQLRRIPATELKIDRSFVQNLYSNEGDRVIVQKMIEMGHDLGMTVVVEGVETIEQLDFLRSSGCDVAQGYLFTRPLPVEELKHWLYNYRSALSR